DLSFALVAPLRAKHRDIHGHATYILSERCGVILLDGNSLTLDQLVAVARDDHKVALSDPARQRVAAARAVVDEFADHDTPTYGINTGFGNFADVKIPHESLTELQVNLLRSHAAGVGEPLPAPVVRAMMLLRANVLAKGFSGVRVHTLE